MTTKGWWIGSLTRTARCRWRWVIKKLIYIAFIPGNWKHRAWNLTFQMIIYYSAVVEMFTTRMGSFHFHALSYEMSNFTHNDEIFISQDNLDIEEDIDFIDIFSGLLHRVTHKILVIPSRVSPSPTLPAASHSISFYNFTYHAHTTHTLATPKTLLWKWSPSSWKRFSWIFSNALQYYKDTVNLKNEFNWSLSRTWVNFSKTFLWKLFANFHCNSFNGSWKFLIQSASFWFYVQITEVWFKGVQIHEESWQRNVSSSLT